MKMLPAFGGFRTCVNANVFDLYPAIENSKCDLSTLISLVRADSKHSPALMEVLKTLLGGVMSANSTGSGDLKTMLSSWSTNTTKLNRFCNTMNTQAGPCIEALVPVLISLLERDAKCCHELNRYLEVLKLLVPTGQTLEQTLIDILNALHQTIPDESSLLGAIIFQAGVPLYAAAENDVCSSLETTSLASGLASGRSIPYYAASCCASGLSKFLQSLDAVMTHRGYRERNSLPREYIVHARGSNNVCSEVCEAGTVSIEPWVHSREMCAGWVDIPRNATCQAGTFFGEETNAGKIIRAFESELHYATFGESGFGGGDTTTETAAQPAKVNVSSVPVFVDAGVIFVAPDGLDGATMAAMVWTWTDNKPDDHLPRVKNVALLTVLRVEAGAATAQLDVNVSTFSSANVAAQLNAKTSVLPAVISMAEISYPLWTA
ncbi:hypothetical protein PHYPSEUDO_005100 [Phytophthora pseudosyringae]|uniref:Uncharacterized protein n=1 Tax=Phytophthora pseudosyringae TaxID=221518 RepID=A0A8T1VPU7_9STRA|nr:hypothetical protein PHYPSEUDO_005100 [Phytophthora pseudosyringae]